VKDSARLSPAEIHAYLLRDAERTFTEAPSVPSVTVESRTSQSNHETPRVERLQHSEPLTESDQIAAAARSIIAALHTILLTFICTVNLPQEPLMIHVVVYNWETRLGTLFEVPVGPCELGSVDRVRRLIALKVWQPTKLREKKWCRRSTTNLHGGLCA
jgi:hypothetical protein